MNVGAAKQIRRGKASSVQPRRLSAAERKFGGTVSNEGGWRGTGATATGGIGACPAGGLETGLPLPQPAARQQQGAMLHAT